MAYSQVPLGETQWKHLGANLEPTEIPGNEYCKANLAVGAPGVQTVDSAGLPIWKDWLCSKSSLPSPGLANCLQWLSYEVTKALPGLQRIRRQTGLALLGVHSTVTGGWGELRPLRMGGLNPGQRQVVPVTPIPAVARTSENWLGPLQGRLRGLSLQDLLWSRTPPRYTGRFGHLLAGSPWADPCCLCLGPSAVREAVVGPLSRAVVRGEWASTR